MGQYFGNPLRRIEPISISQEAGQQGFVAGDAQYGRRLFIRIVQRLITGKETLQPSFALLLLGLG